MRVCLVCCSSSRPCTHFTHSVHARRLYELRKKEGQVNSRRKAGSDDEEADSPKKRKKDKKKKEEGGEGEEGEEGEGEEEEEEGEWRGGGDLVQKKT